MLQQIHRLAGDLTPAERAALICDEATLSKAARRLLLKPAMAPEAPEAPSEEWGWSRTALERFSSRTALTWVDASVRPAYARSVTYASLVACASKVTDLIRRLDDETPASSPIALCLDNGLSFVTCMLGALWAGHSFMPVAIDPQVIQMHADCLPPSINPQVIHLGTGACMDPALHACAHYGALSPQVIQMQMLGMLAQMHVKILFCAPELAPAVQAVVARCAHPVHVCVLDDDEVLFPAKARHCMALARSLYGAYSDAPMLNALPRARCHERVCTFHTSGTPSPAAASAQYGAPPSPTCHERVCTFHTSGTTGTPSPAACKCSVRRLPPRPQVRRVRPNRSTTVTPSGPRSYELPQRRIT